ncbi:MAG: hypothetical protein ACLR7U_08860 [Ruthenibacterium lactatiformans]
MKKNIKKWLAGILAVLPRNACGLRRAVAGAVSSETDASASVVSASDSTSAEAEISFIQNSLAGCWSSHWKSCAEPSDRRSSEDLGAEDKVIATGDTTSRAILSDWRADMGETSS